VPFKIISAIITAGGPDLFDTARGEGARVDEEDAAAGDEERAAAVLVAALPTTPEAFAFTAGDAARLGAIECDQIKN
jgi:hypothetical protein